MSGAFYIVEIVETRRTSYRPHYIEVPYGTEKEALDERAQLLLHFPPTNPWRMKLCIKRPDGSIFNPEFPDIEKDYARTG